MFHNGHRTESLLHDKHGNTQCKPVDIWTASPSKYNGAQQKDVVKSSVPVLWKYYHMEIPDPEGTCYQELLLISIQQCTLQSNLVTEELNTELCWAKSVQGIKGRTLHGWDYNIKTGFMMWTGLNGFEVGSNVIL